jgi:hypothetical protein
MPEQPSHLVLTPGIYCRITTSTLSSLLLISLTSCSSTHRFSLLSKITYTPAGTAPARRATTVSSTIHFGFTHSSLTPITGGRMKLSASLLAVVIVLVLTAPLSHGQDTTLTITGAGNVGIGTTAPTEKVQIGDFGSRDVYLAIKSVGGNQTTNGIKFRNFSDNYGWTLQNDERLGTDGLNFISHFDDSTGISRLFLGKFGGVGIGTTAPLWQLNVQNASRFGTGLALGNESSGGGIWTTISTGELNDEGPGKYLIRSEQADAVRMTIDTAGRVGVGTFAPEERLQIGDFVDASDNYIAVKTQGGNQFKAGIKLLHFANDNGFIIESDETVPVNGLNIQRQSGEASPTSVLYISRENGLLGIGTTSPTHPLEMASGAHVTAGGVWTDASSRHFKENISNLTGEEAVSTLEKLNPVKFNYKAEREEQYVGFIAEDVPDLVAHSNRKSLSPMDIVAVLTRVVQQQQKEIAELGARLNAINAVEELEAKASEVQGLRKENKELSARLTRLESAVKSLAESRTNPEGAPIGELR